MAAANRLVEILKEQLTVMRELQLVLQEEQKAISGLDTASMELLNGQKELLVARQRAIAEQLRQGLTETAVQFGLSPSATLTDIITKMPQAMKVELEPLQQAAKQAGSAVSVLANQNRGMLERFLGVVNDSLGYILRILNTSNTYGVRGTYLSSVQAGAVMVSKEA